MYCKSVLTHGLSVHWVILADWIILTHMVGVYLCLDHKGGCLWGVFICWIWEMIKPHIQVKCMLTVPKWSLCLLISCINLKVVLAIHLSCHFYDMSLSSFFNVIYWFL